MKNTLSIIISLFMVLYACSSMAYKNTTRNQNYLGAKVEIQPNAITQLYLPINALEGSQLTTDKGVEIQFKDKGSIMMQTLTHKTLNIDASELKNFPLYIMGLKNIQKEIKENSELEKTVSQTKLDYQPIKIASFRTPNGEGYLIIGRKHSVIYLTDKHNDSMITKIHIETMSESDINNLIIKGLI